MNKKEILESVRRDLDKRFEVETEFALVLPELKKCGDCASRRYASSDNLSADDWDKIINSCADCSIFRSANKIIGSNPGDKTALKCKVTRDATVKESPRNKQEIMEKVQADMDNAFGVRSGIKTGDVIRAADPTRPVAKKDMAKQVDVLKEALDHYIMVDAWVLRGLADKK